MVINAFLKLYFYGMLTLLKISGQNTPEVESDAGLLFEKLKLVLDEESKYQISSGN